MREDISKYISSIPHEQIARKIRKEAPKMEIKVAEVRSELSDLLSEPGMGESVDDLLDEGGDVPVASAKDKKRIITLAIRNILAKRSAEKAGDYSRDSRNEKAHKPVIRGRKGVVEHQRHKRKEIDDEDVDA